VDALGDAGKFCLPLNQVRARQVVDIVTAYLREHAENRHLPASDLVTAALNQKFPCN
jgi:hypothetical protein